MSFTTCHMPLSHAMVVEKGDVLLLFHREVKAPQGCRASSDEAGVHSQSCSSKAWAILLPLQPHLAV